MKYLLEPMIFAIDGSMSREEFEQYIDNLIEWGQWQEEHVDDIYMLSSTEECLYENDLFPVADKIKILMKRHEVHYISYDTVDKVIRRLIKNAVKIDKSVPDTSDFTRVAVRPFMDTEGRSQSFKEHLDQLMWCAYFMCNSGQFDEKAITLFLKGGNGYLEADIDYFEENGDDYIDKSGSIKFYCNESLHYFLIDELTPVRIWSHVSSKEDIDFGLRISVFQSQSEVLFEDIYHKYDWTIQDSFYEEFRDNSYSTKEKDLRSAILACTYTVTNQNLALVHDIRKSKCGGSKQLVVNGYGAWRRNSTTSIKISYWKKKDRYLFADIAEHDNIEPTQDSSLMI